MAMKTWSKEQYYSRYFYLIYSTDFPILKSFDLKSAYIFVHHFRKLGFLASLSILILKKYHLLLPVKLKILG